MKELLRKSVMTLRRDGVKKFFGKTKNYLVYKVKVRFKSDEVKDVLFVNGCTLPHPERYRVDHQMEQMEANGLTVDKVLYTEVNPDKIKYYRAIIIFRCPITENVSKLIEKAKYFNKKVFFDVDDLVIDKKYTDEIEFVKKMSKADRTLYDDGVVRMGETLKLCDYCITSTTALARELRKYGKEVFVNKNVASEEMVSLSLAAMQKTKKDTNKIRIGYLSGSITHNPDFEMVKPALVKILDEFENVELCVMGYLDIPEEFRRFGDRVIVKPFGDWRGLPKIIAELDINLAPIEKTIFNEAKSENKWTEASLCKVVTVASNYGAFKEVIEDGKTGMLCDDGKDWYTKTKELIVDTKKRKRIAENAHKKAMKEYVTMYSGFGLAEFIESKLARNIAFVLPTTDISGGVNVVLKHCDILRRNGWDVTIINMDTDNTNIENEDGVINVVSGVQNTFSAKFDSMVATLYTTMAFIKTYADVKNRIYLVQSFETDFGSFGTPMRREANSTYRSFSDVRYVTISKWCREWLEKDFGHKVRYAPNGINTSEFLFKKRTFTNSKTKILVEGSSDDYYKNVDESFKIIEKIDKKKYEIVYLSYREGPKSWYYVDKFYNKVAHSEVGKIYEECDILLKTSILESFSYPPLEMLATGGYVVAIPNEGNKEYLKDGVNCLFYEQGDIDAAVEKIEKIVNDAKLRSKLEMGARKAVVDRDWKNIENKVLDLYQ